MSENRMLPARRGLYFEEFEVGQSIISAGRTVTEADVVAFAALTGDWNPMHVDAEFAASHPFGQRVAHGLLGMSIAEGLADRTGLMEGTALAFREIVAWKFSRPIFIGDTIRVRIKVAETKPMPRLGGGMVTYHVTVLKQSEQVAQHGTWIILVRSGKAC